MASVAETAPKPLLRGVSHEVAAFLALAGWLFLAATATPAARAVAHTYGASLFALFAVSASYHRPAWSPRARVWMRRLDHSAIFLLIAGTYTPLCLLLGGRLGSALLAVVWGGAALGIARCLVWIRAPKRLAVALYLALGWVVLPVLPAVHSAVGDRGIALLLGGGLAYTVGAIVYARRSPDPWPRVFGYHEIFHALVIVAAACHFALAAEVVRAIQ